MNTHAATSSSRPLQQPNGALSEQTSTSTEPTATTFKSALGRVRELTEQLENVKREFRKEFATRRDQLRAELTQVENELMALGDLTPIEVIEVTDGGVVEATKPVKTKAAKSAKPANGQKKTAPTRQEAFCRVCQVKGHDLRAHRYEKNKNKPFTTTRLAQMELESKLR